VTSRRYNTLSRCSNNSVSETVKHRQQQQPFVHNDKPTPSQFTAHNPQHPDNGGFSATATQAQYFLLDPEQH